MVMSESAKRPRRGAPKVWVPRHVQVTAAAAEQPHTAEILRRLQAAGVDDVRLLAPNRLGGRNEGSAREIYARAKATMAVVVAPPSGLVPEPIPTSADWGIDLARGCPAHCQYCYLAGSLQGPPVTRVHANLDDVLAGIGTHAGRGTVTSGTTARGHEGTTFELSCYTDPLALEHLTGSLAKAIELVGTGRYGDASLRFTTKFDAVDELIDLEHHGRTRMRVSVNSDEVARRFEGGTASMPARLVALRRMAEARYPVGLTVEAITHRFTDSSREGLQGWYPRTRLEMDEARRTQKRTKFGGSKYVYPREVMSELRGWFSDAVSTRLSGAPLLYWT